MNKFNLTFSGEILAGQNPAQVKLRFGKLFAIDDPVRLERFFSGDTIILRRNLGRKAAAQYYHDLHQLGVVAALVKVSSDKPAVDSASALPPARTSAKTSAGDAGARRGTAKVVSPQPRPGATDKIWAVSSAPATRTSPDGKTQTPAHAAAPNTPAAAQRNSVDIAAQIKARKAQSQRVAAEKAMQQQAALAQQQRKAAEETARLQAQAAELRRIADEESARAEAQRQREERARQEAVAADARRKAAEEDARKEAERAEIERREAEATRKAAAEAAQRKALQEQAKAKRARQKAEKAAKRKAELEAKKRREAEEAARRKAQREEKERREAEEAARRQAALEEKRRQEREEAARLKAEQEELERREAEEAARRQAALEEKRRQEREEAARLKAEQEEIERREAEEAARLQTELDEIARQEAEEAARLEAEREERERQAAAEAARIKAEAQRKQAEAQRKSAERRRAAAEELAAQRARRMEKKHSASTVQAAQMAQQAQQLRQHAEEAARRKIAQQEREAPEQQPVLAAEPLREKAEPRTPIAPAQKPLFRSAKPRVRTGLELPQRRTDHSTEVTAPAQRKRQPGEPNLYTLRPFRITDDVRNRSQLAHQRMRRSYTLGVLALATLLVAGGVFFQQTAAPVINGASALAIDPRSGPLLLAGDMLLLHDRAGVSSNKVALSALGLSTLRAPLAFDGDGALLAPGRLAADGPDPTGSDSTYLLRCELSPPTTCQHLSAQLLESSASAFVTNPLDGSLLLADSPAGQLLKIDREGQIVARATVTLPAHPVMRLHGGLLLVNSADGPAVSVLRYEDSAFGQQLDEILLLPPTAQKAEQSVVGDFLWSGGAWWASLSNPQSGSTGLYRFDEEWNYLGQVALPVGATSLQLANWGEKTLVNDPRNAAIQRFNAEGSVEAPFISTQLAELIEIQQRRARATTLAWRAGILACAIIAVLGFGLGYLQALRRLVYKPRRGHGAEPVDDYVDALLWVDPVPNRLALLRRRGISYGLLVLAALLLAVAQSVTVWQLSALLLALAGPAIALLLLSRQPTGHIGVLQDRLLLVDHRGMYHLAGGASVQYYGPFLLIDDVAVFCGSRLLPAFSSRQLHKLVAPLALGGIKVDRNTALVKLLECHHPLAQGVLAIVATTTAATVLLSLHGIY